MSPFPEIRASPKLKTISTISCTFFRIPLHMLQGLVLHRRHEFFIDGFYLGIRLTKECNNEYKEKYAYHVQEILVEGLRYNFDQFLASTR